MTALSLMLASQAGMAASLNVQLTGIPQGSGEIGCALFTDDAGFPLDPGRREQRWLPASGETRVCLFTDLPAGDYAVAATLDDNGNRRPDTNLLGMPTEAWGVSNNIRPRLRAPAFDDAKLVLDADSDLDIIIDVRR